MTTLALAELDSSRKLFEQVLSLVESEYKLETKMKLFKEVLFIFFRVEDLGEYYKKNEERNFNEEIAEFNRESPPKVLFEKTLFSLHKFLRDGNPNEWIKLLADEEKHFLELKEFNGYVFAQINHYIASSWIDGGAENTKKMVSKLVSKLSGDDRADNKSPEKILSEMKSRISAAMGMYEKLSAYEEKLKRESESS